MAAAAWGLRLCWAAPGGGPGWSEFQGPWGWGARPRGWCLSRLGPRRGLGGPVGPKAEEGPPVPPGRPPLPGLGDRSGGAGVGEERGTPLGRSPRPGAEMFPSSHWNTRPCQILWFGVWNKLAFLALDIGSFDVGPAVSWSFLVLPKTLPSDDSAHLPSDCSSFDPTSWLFFAPCWKAQSGIWQRKSMGNRDLMVKEQSWSNGADLGQPQFPSVGVLMVNMRMRYFKFGEWLLKFFSSCSFLVGGWWCGSGTGWDRQYVTHFFSPICCDFYTGFIATSPASQLSPTELIEMRNDVFNKEKNRQLSLTPRTEKIEVKHVGKTDPGTVFVMNKNVSTPYSCAMRK